MIRNFDDFCRELNSCGFSMGGGNAKGIFALIDYDWLNQDSGFRPAWVAMTAKDISFVDRMNQE